MSKRASRVAILLFALAAAGCVSYVRPSTEAWVEPVDLGLAPTDLAGVKVGVQCGRGDRDTEAWQKALTDGCSGVVKLVTSMGARAIVDEDILDQETAKEAVGAEAGGKKIERPDFSIVYIDRDTDFELDGWSILYFYFMGWIGDKDSQAELRFLDGRDLVIERQRLGVNVRTYYGLPALWLLSIDMMRGGDRHEYRKELAGRLATYIRNAVHTYNVRRLLAEKAAP